MVQSKILSKYTEIVHYFGDKNDSSSLLKLGIKLDNIITAEQIHSNKLVILENDKSKFIEGVDGMITDKPYFLGIRTADCLPIFFCDPKQKIISAIHAGWKGLYTGIITNTINNMKSLQCDPSIIKVVVGPHIQVCCYNVPEERIKKFQITYTGDRLHLLSDDFFGKLRLKSWYLNLGRVALFQLEELGISKTNIEISAICTSCNNNYWSFRRDKAKSGRMLNVIGMIE